MQHWQHITVSTPSSAMHAVATRKALWKTSSVGLEEIYLFPSLVSPALQNSIRGSLCGAKITSIRIISGRPAPVKDLLQTDKQELLPLPGRRFDTSDTTECRVSQYATVRYASNEYSVPVAMAGRNVTVKAFAETIQVFADVQLIAAHECCCGKRQKCL